MNLKSRLTRAIKRNDDVALLTREAAQKAINALWGGEIYYLDHGEYAAPKYQIVENKASGRYAIWATYSYYPGTYRARESRFLCAEDCRLAAE